MLRNALDDSPDRDQPDGCSSNRRAQSLSCPDCTAGNFPNLSKLNKHRNTHERRYNCLAEGCYERFAQRQALTRHTETKHSDADNPKQFYHCTVDGCKYASTGRWRNRFKRADQVKEHIKEYGHYGPQSACDRPRRPGERLYTIQVIKARFEEWTVDEKVDSQPRRTVRSCEYDNSFKTKLWHMDVPGDMFWRGDEEGARDGHACPVEGCYFYYGGPPEGCEKVLFKTLKGLQEHYRRSHESSRSGPSLETLLVEEEIRSAAERSSISTTDSYSTYSPRLGSGSSFNVAEHLGSGFNTFNADHLKGAEWIFCVAGEDTVCYCQSCCQRGTNSAQQSEAMTPQLSTDSSEFPPYRICTTSWPSYPDHLQLSESTTDTGNYHFGVPSSNTTSLFRQDSLKSRTNRIPCDFPGCLKTFHRKYEKQRHVDTVHGSATPFICQSCDKTFLRKDKLFDHLRKIHRTRPPLNSELKRRSMISDTSEYSPYGTISVLPSDTLVRANSSSTSESWMGGIGGIFAEQNHHAGGGGQRSSWAAGLGWRSDSPKPMPLGTSDAPICIEETPSNFF